jgi:diguanylate cyclase (GGDEF)-like protein
LDDTSAVPLLVYSATRDAVEALNSLLRRVGIAAHCTWIPAIQDIPDALEQLNPELLICCAAPGTGLLEFARMRDQMAAMVPLIAVREGVDEQTIAADLGQGARDTVSLQQPERLQAVIARELRAFRLERALTSTLRASQYYRRQLEVVLQRSNDAIAQVQEGILVGANEAWLELFGIADASSVIGHPIMDLFEESTHASLKAALSASLQGRWADQSFRCGALLSDGSVMQLELVLALGEYEGDPAVQLIVPAQKRDERSLTQNLQTAVHSDPGTGLLTRRHLLHAIQERLRTPVPGGLRYLACLRPDKFAAIERQLGVLASESFLIGFVNIMRSLLGPNDLAGHFGGTTLLLLLERGNQRDVDAWCESLLARIGKHSFEVNSQVLNATCSIGLAVVPLADPDLNTAVMDAIEAMRRARERNGNQVVVVDRADNDTRVKAYDQVWVRHIMAALTENRFRLVQQPIAALAGGHQKIFDVAIRMLDAQGKEVLPSEFLSAAARNDLLRSIDRWVLKSSLSLIASHQPDLLFVRISRDSVLDATLLEWLGPQLRSAPEHAARLCLQITEEVADNHRQQALAAIEALGALGVKFALEHFGIGSNSLSLMARLPIDFVKIDGSLMQGLSGSPALQRQVRGIAEAAAARNIQTVAEHVEDANTMAVVWQLGVQYIQGYFVHAPEDVILKS